MEAIWMLAGRRDVKWIGEFNSGFKQFSDDGDVFNAAYGHRWRKHFGYDQLTVIINQLCDDPTTRRAILTIWDGRRDLTLETLDKPCNDMVKFEVDKDNRLNMIVFNRSNDMIWGAYGSNLVHFSMLLEYIAGRTGYGMGTYTQISCDFHAYEEIYKQKYTCWKDELPSTSYERSLHTSCEAHVTPMFDSKESWDNDLNNFVEDFAVKEYKHTFFWVADALRSAWRQWKQKNKVEAKTIISRALDKHGNLDWLIAAEEWFERRS